MEVTNEERHGLSCFEFQLQPKRVPSERHLLWLSSTLSILDVKTHIKGRVAGGWQVIENDVKSVH